jgi:hypothetical protein
MTAGLNISPADAMGSPLLFEPFFRGESWDRWHTVSKAAYGEKLSPSEERRFREVADRNPPRRKVRELIAIAGRGAGKDSIASLLATVAAITFHPNGKLRPGERAVVMTLAVDKVQAKIAFDYIRGYFERLPPLRALVSNMGNTSVSLRNCVDTSLKGFCWIEALLDPFHGMAPEVGDCGDHLFKLKEGFL